MRYELNLCIVCIKLSVHSSKVRAGPDIQVLLCSGSIWFSVNLAVEWSTLKSPLHLSTSF